MTAVRPTHKTHTRPGSVADDRDYEQNAASGPEALPCFETWPFPAG